jgi:hypothetical protein
MDREPYRTTLAVCRLDSDARVPDWAARAPGPLVSITRTSRVPSIVGRRRRYRRTFGSNASGVRSRCESRCHSTCSGSWPRWRAARRGRGPDPRALYP